MANSRTDAEKPHELIVFVWGDEPRRYQLPKSGEVTIGRDMKHNDITIPDSSVSRYHARLMMGGRMLLTDVSSRNGTTVRRSNKQVPADETELVNRTPGQTFVVEGGDRIVFGSVVAILRSPDAERGAASSLAQAGRLVVDPTMRALYGEVSELAASSSRACILILGETGVGKEVLARAIHEASPRATKPFVVINCATLSEALFGSEIFGHVRGAFTGAVADREGYLEYANGGTLVLDEIGELPLALQAKLLRVLEDRQVVRVGANRPRQIDIRIIASTNRDLLRCVEERSFREDLFYRLRGFELAIPPLRARRAEILPLSKIFLEDECNANGNLHVPNLSPDAEACLLAHDFPGNVRELRNAMAYAALHCRGQILSIEHLPPSISGMRRAPRASDSEHATPRQALDEKMRIVEALRAHAGNQTRAAQSLGMPLRTFITRIEKYNLGRPRKRTLGPGMGPEELSSLEQGKAS